MRIFVGGWRRWILPAIAAILFAQTGRPNPPNSEQILALAGGTVVNVSRFGQSTQDIRDSVVLIRGGTIAAVGARGKLSIPPGARVIDVAGKYILPGLVDGFAGLNSQAQANAYLYMGVTTVAGSQDDRRGRLFLTGHPAPHIYLLDGAGSADEFDLLADRPEWAPKLNNKEGEVELSWEDTSRMMDEQARLGVKGLWLGHNLTTANTLRILAKARKLGIPTYGEFIATPYSEAIDHGVSLLLHMTRYELGLIPPAIQRPLAADPEGPLARKAYDSTAQIAPGDPRVASYAKRIASHRVALMPTFSLYYPYLPGHRNLWKEPVAAFLDPRGMFHPTDPATGESPLPEPARKGIELMSAQMWALNEAFQREHPHYLAASGGAVFGSMPGISMHTELELLVRLGLTPREALAAGTGNYAEQFGWRELGRVAAGCRADLVVLDDDPVADIRNSTHIRMVFLEGAMLDRVAMLSHPK
jgi:hypothetical protein